MALADPVSWPESTTETVRYGHAVATSWDRMHPRLTSRGGWAGHPGRLPIVEGTLILRQVERLPGQRQAKPVWLWTQAPSADAAEVIRCWQAYLRRFDLEHTIRFESSPWAGQPRSCAGRPRPTAGPGWCSPRIPSCGWPRPLADDLRRPWERPLPVQRRTPTRVRRRFRYLRVKTLQPARAPKPAHPGTGTPPGMRNW